MIYAEVAPARNNEWTLLITTPAFRFTAFLGDAHLDAIAAAITRRVRYPETTVAETAPMAASGVEEDGA